MEITDPAREFADACAKFSRPSEKRGDDYLASIFDVDPWSTDFFQILFCMTKRADYIANLVNTIDMDDDIRGRAHKNIAAIKKGFSRQVIGTQWKHGSPGPSAFSPTNLNPIRMLSPSVRSKVSFPKLSASEIEALLVDIALLLHWLQEHQLQEQDFIRQALIDGLISFQFRVERLEWLGWGYTTDSLKEIVSAYMALERSAPLDDFSMHHAVILKTKSALTNIYGKLVLAKEGYEVADVALRLYGMSALFNVVNERISGYLN